MEIREVIKEVPRDVVREVEVIREVPKEVIKEVIRTEYVAVPDDSTERHWQEALRRYVRVNGSPGAQAVMQLQELKDLVHSGATAGSI